MTCCISLKSWREFYSMCLQRLYEQYKKKKKEKTDAFEDIKKSTSGRAGSGAQITVTTASHVTFIFIFLPNVLLLRKVWLLNWKQPQRNGPRLLGPRDLVYL